MTDYEAFCRRVQTYRNRLLRLLDEHFHSAMRSRLDPEDIFSELTVKCPRNAREMLSWPPARFYGWLKRVAMRKLCTAYREHFGAQCRSLRREKCVDADHERGDHHSLLTTGTGDPVVAVLKTELCERVRALIELLSHRDRQVLVMRFFEELPANEVAQQLGLSAETYRKAEYRARLQMQLLILPYICL